MEEKINDMMTALGAIAETMWIFYNCLKKQGFNEDQAMEFCMCYMTSITNSHHNNEY